MYILELKSEVNGAKTIPNIYLVDSVAKGCTLCQHAEYANAAKVQLVENAEAAAT